jgi:MYXO-CTERM domain-containing protein
MVPTGSIFEWSWRTRWGARLRRAGLGLVACLVLLVALSAHADWQSQVSLPADAGTPRLFVEAWSPGNFSVGTSTEALLFLDGGHARTLPGGSAGTSYDATAKCFTSVLLSPDGERRSSNESGASCGALAPIASFSSGGGVVRARQSTKGGGAAAVTSGFTSDMFFADAGISSAPEFRWIDAVDDSFSSSLGVVRAGDTLYALVGTSKDNAGVYWFADRGTPRLIPQVNPDAGKVQAIDLFTADGGSVPFAVVGTEKGFLQGAPVELGRGILPVQMLDGGVGVTSVSLNVESGGANGRGFGMAVVALSDGGSSEVMGAVPMLDATQAGTRWVSRPLPPEFAGSPLKFVSCTGASYCVATADGGSKNDLINTNDAGPRISDTVVELGESDAGQFTFTATDTDGDPVLLTLRPSGVAGEPWSLEQVDAGVAGGWRPGDPLVVRVSSGALCESRYVGSFEVLASDGLAAHDTTKVVPVFVRHTRTPNIPPVSLPDSGLVAGQSDPWRMEVLGDVTEAGCKLGFSWSTDAGTVGPSLEQQMGGRVAVLTAPATLCVQGGADFSYALMVSDDAGLSNSQEFKVHVQSNLTPLSAGVLQLTPTPLLPDSVVEVGLGSSNVNCLDSRGLVADLRLEHLDGGVVARETVDFSSGKWLVDTGTGCEGGRFRVAGALEDTTGGHTPETLVGVELPRVAAGLEVPPEEPVLVARCGEGARATLTQAVPEDACQTSDITWSRVSGPELAQDALSGATVSLATRDTGLDTLVGQSVVMRVTANAGPGNEASLQRVLPITVEPFVRVRRRTEAPAASDTGLVGVSITLANTTACAVRDVSFVERLEGLTYVDGSAQFEGQPLEASWVDGVLTVSGLTLEGNGSGRLTYVARPHLVGERRMEGEARLNEVPISLRDTPGTQVPDSGCGCTSSGPGPVLLALGTLVAAVRRRRRR